MIFSKFTTSIGEGGGIVISYILRQRKPSCATGYTNDKFVRLVDLVTVTIGSVICWVMTQDSTINSVQPSSYSFSLVNFKKHLRMLHMNFC